MDPLPEFPAVAPGEGATYRCLACAERPEFPDWPPMREHLRTAHAISFPAKTVGVWRAHFNRGKFHDHVHEWTVDGTAIRFVERRSVQVRGRR